MPRIAGTDLNNEKRVDIALTKLYGVGRSNVVKILKKAGVDAAKRVKDLLEDEINKIQKVIDTIKVEGDLRAEVHGNIESLKQIKAYRGSRHVKNLPAHGQRTRSNARTKRGKRVTIGAIKKEAAEKMGLIAKETPNDKKDNK
ncbi:30S ribosomal protein S13 [Candidatus Gottesmanbacteria bacterium]|nr:30S ribosomal protein S13 [Candidatus Gottesmanbacteria bacterium]